MGDQKKVVLREKRATGINTWAEKKAHSLRVIAITLVYTECRRKYTKPEKRHNPPKTDSAKQLTRSSTGVFDFRLNCFLYARFVTDREKQNGKVGKNGKIPNPVVPCSKPLSGSKVDSAFHPFEVDKMSTRNFWELSGKK